MTDEEIQKALTEALDQTKELLEIGDTSQDKTLEAFLNAGKAKCEDGKITFRPYMTAAFFLFTTEYRKLMTNRYRQGLIKGDGAEWINPLEVLKESILGMLRVQSAMDCGHEQCILECWRASKLIDDLVCGCKGEEDKQKKHIFSTIVV